MEPIWKNHIGFFLYDLKNYNVLSFDVRIPHKELGRGFIGFSKIQEKITNL